VLESEHDAIEIRYGRDFWLREWAGIWMVVLKDDYDKRFSTL
jgi:hypothetical protein